MGVKYIAIKYIGGWTEHTPTPGYLAFFPQFALLVVVCYNWGVAWECVDAVSIPTQQRGAHCAHATARLTGRKEG